MVIKVCSLERDALTTMHPGRFSQTPHRSEREDEVLMRLGATERTDLDEVAQLLDAAWHYVTDADRTPHSERALHIAARRMSTRHAERRVGSGDLSHNARPKTLRRVSPNAGSATFAIVAGQHIGTGVLLWRPIANPFSKT